MRAVAKRRLFEVCSLLAAIALLAATGLQIPGAHAPVDWRKTTIEGFPAGVTARQLEAKLGPPVISEGEAVWTKPNSKFEVRFRQRRDGCHLTGKRLLSGRQVLGEASETPFLLLFPSVPPPTDEYTTESDMRAKLGRGESIMIQNENRDLGEPAEYERSIRYRDQPAGHHELVVNRELWRTGSVRIESFELVWRPPDLVEPVIGGYSAGPNGYSIYPDRGSDLFFSHDLARDGKVILEYWSSQEQIQQALGPPDVRSEDDHWWGYWTVGSPGKMGILIQGDSYKGYLGGVEVARDYRILADHLAQHNVVSTPPK